MLLQEYAEYRNPDCHQKVSVTNGFILASSEPAECTVTAMTITFLAGFAQVSRFTLIIIYEFIYVLCILSIEVFAPTKRAYYCVWFILWQN